MQLDDVVSSVNTDYDRFKEATARSVRWLDRCIQVRGGAIPPKTVTPYTCVTQ